MTETIRKGLNTCIANTKNLQEEIGKTDSKTLDAFVPRTGPTINSILDQILSNQKLTMITLMDILDNGAKHRTSGLETGKFGPG